MHKYFCQLKNQTSFHNFKLRIAANASLDQWVDNRPSISQVAEIWIDGNNPNIPFDREKIVHEHSGYKHRVKHYFGCYDLFNILCYYQKVKVDGIKE